MRSLSEINRLLNSMSEQDADELVRGASKDRIFRRGNRIIPMVIVASTVVLCGVTTFTVSAYAPDTWLAIALPIASFLVPSIGGLWLAFATTSWRLRAAICRELARRNADMPAQ